MTITLEKEAELLQAITDAMVSVSDDSWSGGVSAVDPADAALVALHFISTERQPREAVEAANGELRRELSLEGDQRERAIAAEKEVERLKTSLTWVTQVQPAHLNGGAYVSMTWDEFNAMRAAIGKAPSAYRGKEAKAATNALNMELRIKLETANAALSALPPPVPAEEGGEPARTYSQAEVDSILRAAFPNIPTQAPQDVAGLVEGLEDVVHAYATNNAEPADLANALREPIIRAAAILSALRASPISREELSRNPGQLEASTPAADNNHKALVEADAYLRALLDYTSGFYSAAIAHGMKAGPAADAVQHVERAARNLHRLAAFQSRQEGK